MNSISRVYVTLLTLVIIGGTVSMWYAIDDGSKTQKYFKEKYEKEKKAEIGQVHCSLKNKEGKVHMSYEECITSMVDLREERKKDLEWLGCDNTWDMTEDFGESVPHGIIIRLVVRQLGQLNQHFDDCHPIFNAMRWTYGQVLIPLTWKAQSRFDRWWYYQGGREIADFIRTPADAAQQWFYRNEQLRVARENLSGLLKATACEDMLCLELRTSAIGAISTGLYVNDLDASDIGVSSTMLVKEWQKVVRQTYTMWVNDGKPNTNDEDSEVSRLCDFTMNAGNLYAAVDVHDHGLTKAEVESLNCDLREWSDVILHHRTHKSHPFNHRHHR